jgi:hypothetical protein
VILGLGPQVAQSLRWEGDQWTTGCKIIIVVITKKTHCFLFAGLDTSTWTWSLEAGLQAGASASAGSVPSLLELERLRLDPSLVGADGNVHVDASNARHVCAFPSAMTCLTMVVKVR